MQMKPKFHPPFKRCYSEDGEHLLGVVQRFEIFDFVVNTDVISVDTAEKEGWSLFSNPDFAQRFGILAYDDWNVIDICMGAGVHPFRDKGDAEIAKFTETANLWVNNAKMITTDFVQLNLGCSTATSTFTSPAAPTRSPAPVRRATTTHMRSRRSAAQWTARVA
jgi:spermidine/putrescine transport system substrate-binding protein